MKARGLSAAVLLLLAVAAAACSTGGAAKSNSRMGKGFLPPGSPGTTMSGNGSWILEFEARDGEATAHYRFEVTRDQYNRYQEGARVQLILSDERLREIRSSS